MIVEPTHGRKLGLLGVAMTMQRENRYTMKAMEEIRDEVEKIMITTCYLERAPFSWVSVAIRYGLKNDYIPTYQKINKKYGDLPLSIEIDVNETIGVSFEEMKSIIKNATLIALIDAGKKYDLPIKILEKERQAIRG